jgi:hypothetical protein
MRLNYRKQELHLDPWIFRNPGVLKSARRL